MDGLQFNGVIAAAANVPSSGEAGTYTAEMFLEDFPQFSRSGTDSRVSLVPEGILGIFIRNANQSILPSRYFEKPIQMGLSQQFRQREEGNRQGLSARRPWVTHP